MKSSYLTSVLILLTILHTVSSEDKRVNLKTTEEAIINLNQENFEHLVDHGRSERWFVMFHIGCPSCEEVYPLWNNFTKSRRGIRLGSLNATAYPDVAAKYSVSSFPSFVFFDEGKMELYQGENTVDAWNDFISRKKGADNINQTIPDAAPQEDHIVDLNLINFDDFVLNQSTRPWFIMFHTHCPECEAAFPAWREFAKSRKEGPNIGMIDCEKNPQLAQRFDIETFPTFVYFEDGEKQIFKGERKVKDWSQYVDQRQNKDLAAGTPVMNITNKTDFDAQPLNIEASNPPVQTSEAPLTEEGPGVGDAIVELTQDNFETLVNSENSGSWFVMFYAPWCPHCQRASPIWKEFANTRKEGIKVGMVDCVAHPGLAGKYNIPGFPTFVYFDGGKTEVFNGERSVESWSQFVDLKKNSGIAAPPAPESIEGPDEATTHLTKENFDALVNSEESGPWFIMFYAPWCPHCQRAAPTWKELARTKKEGARIGMVNCVEQPELQGKYNIQGFPTFMFFDHGKTEIFDGPRTVEDWSQFIDQKRPVEMPTVPNRPTPDIANEGREPNQEGAEVPDVPSESTPSVITNERREPNPEQELVQEPIKVGDPIPEPAIGNLNALNTTTEGSAATDLTPGLLEPTIGGLNALNRSSEVKETPITTIAYERPAAGATEDRPSITVETMERRPNEGRFEDNTIHYKEPMLVIGVIAAILLGSFFLFMCYQQFRGKYTPISTSDHDVEAAPVDSSTVQRDSFSHSMRF